MQYFQNLITGEIFAYDDEQVLFIGKAQSGEEAPKIFYNIAEKMQAMKEISEAEANAYLNPPQGKEELVASAEVKKTRLQEDASSTISILERAVKYGIATEDEKAALEKWERYSVLLSRVDTSKVPDIDWPEVPNVA